MVVTSSVSLMSATDRAGVERLAVDVGGAGLADVDAAAVLRAGEAEDVAQHPQQPDVVLDVDGDRLPVEEKVCCGTGDLLSRCGSRPSVGDSGTGGTKRLDARRPRVVVVDRELRRHLAGGPGERAGDRRGRGRDTRLAGTAGLLGVGVDDHDLELGGMFHCRV